MGTYVCICGKISEVSDRRDDTVDGDAYRAMQWEVTKLKSDLSKLNEDLLKTADWYREIRAAMQDLEDERDMMAEALAEVS